MLNLAAAIANFVARVSTESMPPDVADELARALGSIGSEKSWKLGKGKFTELILGCRAGNSNSVELNEDLAILPKHAA